MSYNKCSGMGIAYNKQNVTAIWCHMITGNEKILVVDDAPNLRRAFCRMLELSGYRAVEAHSGEDALQKLEGEEVALILMDVVMPGMSGIETARKIRERMRREPIILMSAYGEEHVEQAGYSESEGTFLRKPIEEATLVRGLARALDPSLRNGAAQGS